MLSMASSSTIVTREDEEDQRTPTHSPVEDPGGHSLQSFSVSRSLENPEKSREHRGVSGSSNNLHEYFSCSSENNSYSFYLGCKKISSWGSCGSPLLTESRSNARGEERRGRSVTRKRDLPPFLTTLDCNGRPRFHHRRVRSESRLEITYVAVDSPEIVSVRGREGLRIGTVRISQQNEQDEDDDKQLNHCSSS